MKDSANLDKHLTLGYVKYNVYECKVWENMYNMKSNQWFHNEIGNI